MRRCLAVLATAGLLLATALPAPSASISEVKSAGNWMQVTVEGIVTYVEPVECYIQSRDRSSGIRVIGPTDGLTVGDSVLANGTFAVVDGEPTVTGASIIPQGTPSAISPFGMTNRDIGGASKWSPLSIWDYTSRRFVSGDWVREWTRACGANNTGLLVSTWGTVRSLYSSPVTGARWMYVDDGSGVVSDLGDTGLLVYSEADVNRGDFVRVTGVSSTEPSIEHPGRLVRVIRTRSSEDVQVERAREFKDRYDCMFSDEFDEPEIDPRWRAQYPHTVSQQILPGWLTIDLLSGYSRPFPSAWLYHCAVGDWDLELKILLGFPDGTVRYKWTFGVTAIANAELRGSYAQPIELVLAGRTSTALVGDTCYIRLRKRGSTAWVSASFDGIRYTNEEEVVGTHPDTSITLHAEVLSLSGLYQHLYIHLDYFRITPVVQEEEHE